MSVQPIDHDLTAALPTLVPRTRRILIVSDMPESTSQERMAVWHHLHTLQNSKAAHEIVHCNLANTSRPDGFDFDAVILHNSLLCNRWAGPEFFEWKRQFHWISDLKCLRIAIPQDEADHAFLLDEWLLELGVGVIFSVHYREDGPLYPMMRHRAAIYPCLPGYIHEPTASGLAGGLTPTCTRPLDIVYRARHLPYWFGSAGQLKHRIAEWTEHAARDRGLRCDISTRPEDGILGEAWFDLLCSSRATIGIEGGSSVLDARGETRAAILGMLEQQSELTFQEVSDRMTGGWNDHRFLTITPRHFEAVITKTCQILVRGDYRGILQADRHYIPLEPDGSNVEEALDKLADDRLVEQMVENAYQDVYLAGHSTYSDFARLIEKAIDEHAVEPAPEIPRPHDALFLLEQQLVAERHTNALHRARLEETLSQAMDHIHACDDFQQELRRVSRWHMILTITLATSIVVAGLLLFLRTP